MHRITRLRRTTAALAVPTLLALGVSACGGTQQEQAADPAAAAASTAPDRQPGDAVSVGDLGDLYDRAFRDAGSARIALAGTGGFAFHATGAGDFTPGAQAVEMKISMPSGGPMGGLGDLEVRLVDQKLYLHVGDAAPKWAMLDLADPKGPLAGMGDLMTQFDPRDGLDAVKAAFVSGTYVGPDQVDGVAADHYTFTVDTQKLVAAFARDLPGAADTTGSSMLDQLPKQSTQDLWIDGAGHIARVTTGLSGATVSATFTDWGAPVTVTAPPADQVGDLGSMMGGLMGSMGSLGGDASGTAAG